MLKGKTSAVNGVLQLRNSDFQMKLCHMVLLAVRNNKGTSLVTVLIASSIMTVVMLAVFTSINSASDSVANITALLSADDIANEIRMTLKVPSFCSYNLTNSPQTFFTDVFDPSNANASIRIQELRAPADGRPLFAANQKIGKIKITNITMLRFRPVVANTSYLATIRIGIDKLSTSVGGKSIVRDIEVALQTTPDGANIKISNCWTSATITTLDLQSICASMSGTWNTTTDKCDLPIPPPVVLTPPEPVAGAPAVPSGPTSIPPDRPQAPPPDPLWQATPEVCFHCSTCSVGLNGRCGPPGAKCSQGGITYTCR